MKQALITLILFITLSDLFAQNFRPGYYVRTSGDTVHTDLFLRKKKGDIIGILSEGGRLLGPSDITAAHIDDVTYIVKTVTLDKSPKGGSVIDTVFLELMSREKMSLFYSSDENDKHHFFIEDESGLIEELGLHILDRGDGITFQDLPTYKDKLKAFFPTCNDFNGEIDQTRYTKNSMRSIFSKLYECKYGSPPEYESVKDVVHDFGIIFGLSTTTLAFEDKGHGNIASSVTFNKSNDLTGGIFLESSFAKTGYMLSLRQELIHRKYNSNSSDYYRGIGPTQIYGMVKANYIKYNFIARAALSQNSIRPFINVGVSPSLLVDHNEHMLIISASGRTTETLLGKTRLVEFGFFGGAGVAFNNFVVEVRAEQSTGLNPQNYQSKVNTLYFLLSYRLFEGNK